jgi:nucleotide-binding universal stress UspA family protein
MSGKNWCQAAWAPGRTVLFAVSDTPETFAAFSWARANLLREEDNLVLVHAYEKDRLFGGQNPLAEGQRVLAKYEALCTERGVRFRVVLSQGCPAKVVAGAAHANEADLCVMGCRGLSAVKRALVGSVRCALCVVSSVPNAIYARRMVLKTVCFAQVSSKVASACSCPVMVIKRPRDEVGAFLTVLPRRVFIRVDGTSEASAAFDWAENTLLSPEIDEVFLMLSSQQTKKAAGWLGIGKVQHRPLQDREAERMEVECMADAFQDRCIRLGFNASKIRVESGSAEDMIRDAELKSCDLLVVGRPMGAHAREEAGLYAAHNAPFPVIVVGDSAAAQHRAVMRSCRRPVSAGPPVQQQATPLVGRTLSAGCSRAASHSPHASKSKPPATLGPRSSSLERLLNALADKDEATCARSRRNQEEEDLDEEERGRRRSRDTDDEMVIRRPSCVLEEEQCDRDGSWGSGGGSGGMRRVATRSSIAHKAHTKGAWRGEGGGGAGLLPTVDSDSCKSASAQPSPATIVPAAGHDLNSARDAPPHFDLGGPWMRAGGEGAPAMMAT